MSKLMHLGPTHNTFKYSNNSGPLSAHNEATEQEHGASARGQRANESCRVGWRTQGSGAQPGALSGGATCPRHLQRRESFSAVDRILWYHPESPAADAPSLAPTSPHSPRKAGDGLSSQSRLRGEGFLLQTKAYLASARHTPRLPTAHSLSPAAQLSRASWRHPGLSEAGTQGMRLEQITTLRVT